MQSTFEQTHTWFFQLFFKHTCVLPLSSKWPPLLSVFQKVEGIGSVLRVLSKVVIQFSNLLCLWLRCEHTNPLGANPQDASSELRQKTVLLQSATCVFAAVWNNFQQYLYQQCSSGNMIFSVSATEIFFGR